MVREDKGDFVFFRNQEAENEYSSNEPTEFGGDTTPRIFDVDWNDTTTEFHEPGDWIVHSSKATDASPGTWDPNSFAKQAPSSWQEPAEAKRIQDLPSALLVEPEPHERISHSDEEDWPFKSPCKMEEKRKKRMTPKNEIAGASDIDSDEEIIQLKDDSVDDGTRGARRIVSSDETDEDEDIVEDAEEDFVDANKEKSFGRRGRKKDHGPTLPDRRGSNEYALPQPGSDQFEDEEYHEQPLADEAEGSTDRVRKPRRRNSRGDDGEEQELNQGSFQKLIKDPDKKSSRSNSRGRRTRTPGSSSGRRRRYKESSMDYSGHSLEDDGEELRSDGTPTSTTISGRRSWRDRQIQNRRPHGMDGSQILQAPGSGGRRPVRRAQRSSSERWMRAVEGVEPGADGTEVDAIRRNHSGGVRRMQASLGMDGRRTPNRRPPRKTVKTPNSDRSGSDDYEYEMNMSCASARSLDSIEDLEDFEHTDFKTPGMVDYDEEMIDLMQRANPEHTAQLQRRVGRKREAINYDQNMPMMTRQALLTRTASSQVQRQYVDQSNIDRDRLLVRTMSGSSTSVEELAMSQHRQQFARGPMMRRPPPRTKSSGMAALSRSDHEERRRGVNRTKSGTSTSTFRHNQKPNRVSSLQRRQSGDGFDGGRRGAPDERKSSLSRAQSMHATVGRRSRPAVSPRKPQRRAPKTIEPRGRRQLPREEQVEDDESSSSSSSSSSEDSDLIDEFGLPSPEKPGFRKAALKKPESAPKAVSTPVRKKVDKRDFSVKRNRSKLHAMLYEAKMGIDMTEVLTQVQQGETPRSPHKTLLMPSP